MAALRQVTLQAPVPHGMQEGKETVHMVVRSSTTEPGHVGSNPNQTLTNAEPLHLIFVFCKIDIIEITLYSYYT